LPYYASYLLDDDDKILKKSSSSEHRIGQLVEYYLSEGGKLTGKAQYQLQQFDNNSGAGGGAYLFLGLVRPQRSLPQTLREKLLTLWS
jgi:hypothetical protein